jgi:hypothetical protein
MLERSCVVKEVDSGHEVEIPEMLERSRIAQHVLDSQPRSFFPSSRGAIHFLRNIHPHDSRSSTPPELVRVVSRATGEIEYGQTRDVTEDLKHGWKLDKAAEGYQGERFIVSGDHVGIVLVSHLRPPDVTVPCCPSEARGRNRGP